MPAREEGSLVATQPPAALRAWQLTGRRVGGSSSAVGNSTEHLHELSQGSQRGAGLPTSTSQAVNDHFGNTWCHPSGARPMLPCSSGPWPSATHRRHKAAVSYDVIYVTSFCVLLANKHWESWKGRNLSASLLSHCTSGVIKCESILIHTNLETQRFFFFIMWKNKYSLYLQINCFLLAWYYALVHAHSCLPTPAALTALLPVPLGYPKADGDPAQTF